MLEHRIWAWCAMRFAIWNAHEMWHGTDLTPGALDRDGCSPCVTLACKAARVRVLELIQTLLPSPVALPLPRRYTGDTYQDCKPLRASGVYSKAHWICPVSRSCPPTVHTPEWNLVAGWPTALHLSYVQ